MSLSITIRFKNESNNTSAWDEIGAKPCRDADDKNIEKKHFEPNDIIKIVADEDKEYRKGHISIIAEIVIKMEDGKCKTEIHKEYYIIEKSGGEATFPK